MAGMPRAIRLIKGMDGTRAEIVQSLAKWKRMMLAECRAHGITPM